MLKNLLLLISLLPAFCYAQESLQQGKTIEKKLLKDEKHSYSIDMKVGECAFLSVIQKGVDVAVDIINPLGQKLKTLDSPNGDVGEEPIFIEASQDGKYNIIIYPFNGEWTEADKKRWQTANPRKSFDSLLLAEKEKNQGNYEINNYKVLSVAESKKKVKDEYLNKQKTIKWLIDNAHPLKSVVAGSGFEDLQWLKPVLKDVPYVGLGEATHGTREFFQMKHRMLEFLVRQMGFTVFAMEASYQGCENINNYILYGKGDAYSALASQGFWTWNTEEVIDMIEWMRKYNRTVPNNKKVQFFGFDIQQFAKSGAIDSVRNYLKKVDTTLAKRNDKLLQWLYKQDSKNLYTAITNSIQGDTGYVSTDTIQHQLSYLLVSLAMKKGDYILRSSKSEYEKNFYNVTNMLQFVETYNPKNMRSTPGRDYYMASNFMNFVQQNPEAKIAVWAHNSHISKKIVSKSFGGWLNLALGGKYFPIGFAFNKGSFQALELNNIKLGGLREFTVPEAKEGSLEWYFAQTKKGNSIVNLRQRNLPVDVLNFLESVIPSRGFGGSANPNTYTGVYRQYQLINDFDAVIFHDNTTRARPTPKGRR